MEVTFSYPSYKAPKLRVNSLYRLPLCLRPNVYMSEPKSHTSRTGPGLEQVFPLSRHYTAGEGLLLCHFFLPFSFKCPERNTNKNRHVNLILVHNTTSNIVIE